VLLSALITESYDLNTLPNDLNSKVITVRPEWLGGSGLMRGEKKFVIYNRDAVSAQFKFLREQVVQDGFRGEILGRPGTGKSTAAYIFALNMLRSDWDFTWVHINATSHARISIVRFAKGKKSVGRLGRGEHEQFKKFLYQADNSRSHSHAGWFYVGKIF
jgi:hypothetical protein